MSSKFHFLLPPHPLFAFACYRACDSEEHIYIQTLTGAGNPRAPFLYRMPGLPLHRLWKGFSNLSVCWNHLCVGVSRLVVCDSLQPQWTAAWQAPLSMEFSRQEYWSGLTLPSLGDLPNPGIEPGSPALQADSLSSEPQGKQPAVYPSQSLWLSQSSMGPQSLHF